MAAFLRQQYAAPLTQGSGASIADPAQVVWATPTYPTYCTTPVYTVSATTASNSYNAAQVLSKK